MNVILGATGAANPAFAAGEAAELSADVTKKFPLRVLVADDEALIRWSVSQALTDLGVHVEQADTGSNTLAAIDSAARPFDVVVLDLRLPDVDDLSLIARIRQTHAATAVVLMTAFGTPDLVRSAYALGVRTVLTKPFDLHDMADVVLAAAQPS